MDLQVENLGKQYDGTWVLDKINLSIAEGEFFSLLGGSGSGKTTLLKLIAGIEEPDHGKILHHGRDIAHDPMEKRPFNTVFQGYALFPHMTVFENVAFGLRVKGVEERVLKKTVTDMVARVGLADRISAFPAQLSGGQQQRVAIARVLVCEPKVILLDEPLSALDASLRGQMQSFLKELHRDFGLTFIFVTHDQDEAISLSDRVCILNNGLIEQVGTPDELYGSPKTKYVAEFIGKNNIIPGKVTGDIVETGFGSFPNKCSDLSGEVLLSVRPESISIGIIGNDNSLVVEVVLKDRQYHGDNTLMTFANESGQVICVRESGQGSVSEIGSKTFLSIPLSSIAKIPARGYV